MSLGPQSARNPYRKAMHYAHPEYQPSSSLLSVHCCCCGGTSAAGQARQKVRCSCAYLPSEDGSGSSWRWCPTSRLPTGPHLPRMYAAGCLHRPACTGLLPQLNTIGNVNHRKGFLCKESHESPASWFLHGMCRQSRACCALSGRSLHADGLIQVGCEPGERGSHC